MYKKKILHLKVGEWIVGGIESLIINVHDKLKEHYIFDLYGISYHTNFEFFPYMQDFIDNGSSLGLFKRGALISPLYWREIDQFFKANCYDILQIHIGTTGIILAKIFTYYAKKNGVKQVVYHSHSTEKGSFTKTSFKYKMGEMIIPFLFRVEPDRCVACSEMAGERTFGCKPFEFVRNGIDLEKFKFNLSNRQKIRDEFKIDDETFVIGHVGRMDDNKNQTFLLDVFSLYLKQKPHSKLILVGNGETRQILEEKVKTLGLESSVIFTGIRSDVNAFYSAFDCFVLPSFFEGLGIVLIEAQCAGLPCVVAEKNIPLQAKFRTSFIFLPLNQPLAHWIDAIDQVREIKNNRETAYLESEVQKWSIENTVQQFINIYEDIACLNH